MHSISRLMNQEWPPARVVDIIYHWSIFNVFGEVTPETQVRKRFNLVLKYIDMVLCLTNIDIFYCVECCVAVFLSALNGPRSPCPPWPLSRMTQRRRLVLYNCISCQRSKSWSLGRVLHVVALAV